jgi:hypothetical protein
MSEDISLRRIESLIEIDRPDHRLESIGEDIGIILTSCE